MSPFRARPPSPRAGSTSASRSPTASRRVTFDRPEKLNALTFDAYADLRDLLAELPAPRRRARARRSPARAAGSAPAATSRRSSASCRRWTRAELLEFTRMTGAVVQGAARVPAARSIAAVNGVAAGAGSVIALASDFRLLATLGVVRVPLHAASGSPAPTWARRTCCRGSSGSGARPSCSCSATRSTAEEALGVGLATQVVDDDELRDAADGARAPARRRAGARLLDDEGRCSRASSTWTSPASIELEAMTQALLMLSHDHREFYAAWSERPHAGLAAGDERARDRHRAGPGAAGRLRARGRRRARARRAPRRADRARTRRHDRRRRRWSSSSTSRPATSSPRCAPPAASPSDLVSMQIFVTDVAAYKAALRELGPVWQRALRPPLPGDGPVRRDAAVRRRGARRARWRAVLRGPAMTARRPRSTPTSPPDAARAAARRRRRSARDVLAPLARGRRRARSNRPLVRALAEHGLLGRAAPHDDEGWRPTSALDLCLIREGLARHCTEAETAFAVQGLGAFPILQSGRPERVAAWLPRARDAARRSPASR